MNRFQAIALALLLVLVVSTAATAAGDAPFFFVQLADPQLGYTNRNDPKDGIAPDVDHLKQAIQHINRLKPAFVLISGDMTHQPHDPAQIRAFLGLIGGISPGIPLYLAAGNHDVGSAVPMNVSAASSADVRSYEKELSVKDHYSFSYHGSEFLVIDSPLISDKSDNGLRDAQTKWFETQLASAHAKKPTHVFVCGHQPWFLKSIDEPDTGRNVPLAYRRAYLDLMDRYGVDYFLGGHLHYELIGQYRGITLLTDGPVSKSIATPPVAGLRIIRVYPDRVEHEFYALDRVPAEVKM